MSENPCFGRSQRPLFSSIPLFISEPANSSSGSYINFADAEMTTPRLFGDDAVMMDFGIDQESTNAFMLATSFMQEPSRALALNEDQQITPIFMPHEQRPTRAEKDWLWQINDEDHFSFYQDARGAAAFAPRPQQLTSDRQSKIPPYLLKTEELCGADANDESIRTSYQETERAERADCLYDIIKEVISFASPPSSFSSYNSPPYALSDNTTIRRKRSNTPQELKQKRKKKSAVSRPVGIKAVPSRGHVAQSAHHVIISVCFGIRQETSSNTIQPLIFTSAGVFPPMDSSMDADLAVGTFDSSMSQLGYRFRLPRPQVSGQIDIFMTGLRTEQRCEGVVIMMKSELTQILLGGPYCIKSDRVRSSIHHVGSLVIAPTGLLVPAEATLEGIEAQSGLNPSLVREASTSSLSHSELLTAMRVSFDPLASNVLSPSSGASCESLPSLDSEALEQAARLTMPVVPWKLCDTKAQPWPHVVADNEAATMQATLQAMARSNESDLDHGKTRTSPGAPPNMKCIMERAQVAWRLMQGTGLEPREVAPVDTKLLSQLPAMPLPPTLPNLPLLSSELLFCTNDLKEEDVPFGADIPSHPALMDMENDDDSQDSFGVVATVDDGEAGATIAYDQEHEQTASKGSPFEPRRSVLRKRPDSDPIRKALEKRDQLQKRLEGKSRVPVSGRRFRRPKVDHGEVPSVDHIVNYDDMIRQQGLEHLQSLRDRLRNLKTALYIKTITKIDLMKLAAFSREEIASTLGICETYIKKIFRKHGVQNWIYKSAYPIRASMRRAIARYLLCGGSDRQYSGMTHQKRCQGRLDQCLDEYNCVISEFFAKCGYEPDATAFIKPAQGSQLSTKEQI